MFNTRAGYGCLFRPRVRCSGRAVVSRASLGPDGPGRASRQRDVFQAHRAAPAEELPGLPSARRHRPDVPPDLRRGPALGADDQDAASLAREMPPYRYDRIGIAAPEGRSAAQRRRDADLRAWADGGAPRGNLADMPPPPAVPRHHQVGLAGPLRSARRDRPDQALRPAGEGQDRWWRPIVPLRRADDRCIKAMAVKPSLKGRAGGAPCQQRSDGARREDLAVHHARARLRSTPRARPVRSCRPTAAARCRPTR